MKALPTQDLRENVTAAREKISLFTPDVLQMLIIYNFSIIILTHTSQTRPVGGSDDEGNARSRETEENMKIVY